MTKTIICDNCNGTGYAYRWFGINPSKETCSQCDGIGTLRVLMTNADCIRDMSDEELADAIACPYDGICFSKGDCHECCLEWLRKSAED